MGELYMSYWINDNVRIGNARQLQFFCDSDADIADLPTSITSGVQQGLDTISNRPCGKGSIALSIESGDLFILNSENTWEKLDIPSSGNGSGSSDGSVVSQDTLTDIGEAIVACFKKVVWTDNDGQDYIDDLMEAFGIEEEEPVVPVQTWDYEWNASSQQVPPNMTYGSQSYDSASESYLIFAPNLNFNYVGDSELEIECKWYAASGSATQQDPQIVMETASGNNGNNGAKIWGNPTSGRNINTTVTGSIVVTDVSCDDFHVYNMKSVNGHITLTVDGTVVIEGNGASNSQYITRTGIYATVVGCALYIKSIKFKEG